jgi:hypothetical protein
LLVAIESFNRMVGVGFGCAIDLNLPNSLA